jgi:hypothetical protein
VPKIPTKPLPPVPYTPQVPFTLIVIKSKAVQLMTVVLYCCVVEEPENKFPTCALALRQHHNIIRKAHVAAGAAADFMGAMLLFLEWLN